jgi:putative phosphoribosyl transferase
MPRPPSRLPAADLAVRIPAGQNVCEGDLTVPPGASGLVVFAHGSGSSRHSPRNRQVAHALQAAGLGTLLFDLLSPAEERADAITGRLRFDIGFLATRLMMATRWIVRQPSVAGLSPGFFGASTGAAAALVAAAELTPVIHAVVSRGGRPDLAGEALPRVICPTLLLVGGEDETVLELNRRACQQLTCVRQLTVIPGATHLFEELGALEQVAGLAADWFKRHLNGKHPQAS